MQVSAFNLVRGAIVNIGHGRAFVVRSVPGLFPVSERVSVWGTEVFDPNMWPKATGNSYEVLYDYNISLDIIGLVSQWSDDDQVEQYAVAAMHAEQQRV